MGALDLNTGPDLPPKTDYGIGCIGAGFIMKDIHLVAYGEAGFNVVAIASRTPANAQAAADERGVETVYDTWQELLDDERTIPPGLSAPVRALYEQVLAGLPAMGG